MKKSTGKYNQPTEKRKHSLSTLLESNVDLTVFSNTRVSIQKVDEGKFLIASKLRFYKCELGRWAFDFIKSNLPNKKYSFFTGTCSSPSGIFTA